MTTAVKRQSPEPQQEPEKTEGQKIAELESATETMAAYVGYLSTKILNEEDQERPNQEKLRALEAQKDQVLKERREMRPDNHELIAKARYIYGPIMKALYA